MTTHEDIARRLDSGDRRFASIDRRLAEISEKLEPLPRMREDIGATREIVEAWTAAKAMGRFLKWASGLIAALGAIWLFVKAGAMRLFG